MSRFKSLRSYLPLPEALSVYMKVKYKGSKKLRLGKLREPFSLRDNPYDYATFEEVLLREEYNIPLNFTPVSIIDAGANIGLTALYFANRFASARVVSLEPDSDNYSLLKANTEAYTNIIPLQCGLWYKDAYLEVVDGGKGNNAFTVKEVPVMATNAIKAVSVASIMQEQQWSQVDILKIDIEGSEKKVFESGFTSWLPMVKVLIIELHDRVVPGSSAAVFKAMNQYNFSVDIKGENLVFTNNDLA